jgi:Putative prokaryotic signal transducing protein
MAYCPLCGTEYEESARECMDCRVPLRPGPPPPVSQETGGQSDVRLATVRTFLGAAFTDAELAKNLLESEGIPCLLTGANAARLYHALDVQLMVREQDAERAARILREYSDAAPPEDETA